MDGEVAHPVAIRTPTEASSRPDYPPGDMFGLRDMMRTLLRRRMIIGGVCALITVLGAGYAFLRAPVYEATAVLMMRPSEPDVSGTAERTRAEPDSGYVASQVEILRSPALALQLADRQHLADDPRWASGHGAARRDSAARAAAAAINAQRRDGTYIVDLTARAPDPQQAANLANDLVNVYFASREQARIENAAQTSSWLGSRLNELRHEVEVSENAVEQYRAQHGLLMVEGTMLSEQQLRDAEATVVAARADLAERQARNRQVRSALQGGGSAESLSGALTSDTMAALRSRQADVTRRLAEYSERYGDLHPTVQNARAERDDIQRQIQAEVSRLAQNLDDEAEISQARVSTLQGHLASVRAQLNGNNAEQVRLRELERNAQAARAVYENFLMRYHEVTDGASTGLGGDAQVIASATAPNDPVSRSPFLIVFIAFALGLVAGALAAFLAEQLSTTLQSSDEVEQRLGVPILTSIPELRAGQLRKLAANERHPAGFVVANPLSAFAESMRMLRARIAHAGFAEGLKVVAMTSAMAGEGKSSTALSLARVAALAGRKVILVDCDLRRRSLNHMLCIEPRSGISQVLRGELEWRKAIGRDELSGAHILPAAAEEFTSEDLFGSATMRQLMQDLSAAYDLVLLDCAPVLALAEVRDLAALADGVVLVVRRKATEVVAMQTAVHELRAVNAAILGVAFNGVDLNARATYADPLYFSHARKHNYYVA